MLTCQCLLIKVAKKEVDDVGQQAVGITFYPISSEARNHAGSIYQLYTPAFRPANAVYRICNAVKTTERVVKYNYQPYTGFCQTRDCEDWVVKYIDLTSHGLGMVETKCHRKWPDNEKEARLHAFERLQANVYTAMMLKNFQDTLFCKWTTEHNKRKRDVTRAFHFASGNLKVVPAFVMNPFLGDKGAEESHWLICEAKSDAYRHRYMYEYVFNNYTHSMDPAQDLVYAFAHHVYITSDRQTLIAQLDCDSHGNISGLICFTKDQEESHNINGNDMLHTIERAFIHFEDQHDCNPVCRALGLAVLR
ncbi:hypothetical protein DFH28DRAFT_878521 [Melampsora americana]|nr:hypothetical protein DFH28DRAFT_878521 [Melampsora americana]